MSLRPLDLVRSPLYLLGSFPLGIAYFTLLSAVVSAGVSLLVFVVGVFVFAGGSAVTRRVAAADAALTARVYDTPVPELSSPSVDGGLLATARAELLCPDSYRAAGYLLVRFVAGVAGFTAVVAWLTVSAALLATPFLYDRPGFYVGAAGVWVVDTLAAALAAAALGVVVAVAGAVAVAAAGRAVAVASARLLAGPT